MSFTPNYDLAWLRQLCLRKIEVTFSIITNSLINISDNG